MIFIGLAIGLVIGVVIGMGWYGWIIASSLSKGRLPKSLEAVGFTLPDKYKK